MAKKRLAVDTDAGLNSDEQSVGRHKQYTKLKSPQKEWKPHFLLAVARNHQIDVPLFLCSVALIAAVAFPDSVFAKMPFLSYKLPDQNLYYHGWDDLYFVSFYMVFLIFLRAFTMNYVLKPLSLILGAKKSTQERFAEQAWCVIYYTTTVTVGLSLAYNSPYWLSTKHFWIDYPHLYLSFQFKLYYLLQLSFCINQIYVLHIEKPRKDYWEYVFHHLITITLVVLSYVGNFTRIGNAVFVTMDMSDVFLALAKCFNYIRWRKLCDSTFVMFVITWLFTRHYIYFYIVQSLWWDMPVYTPIRWDPPNGWFISISAMWIFIGLFAFLQIIMIIWLYAIVRLVMKVLRGTNATDSRSDSEMSDNDATTSETKPLKS
ncbi:Sphingosine N-acyltransferase lag1 [Sorochytrium milnesiophthora]